MIKQAMYLSGRLEKIKVLIIFESTGSELLIFKTSALGRKLTLIQTIRQFPICLLLAQTGRNHNKSLRPLSWA